MHTQDFPIAIDGIELVGTLVVPPHPTGFVIFAHGSASSRHSPRNRQVARLLQEHGLATLLLDLLTTDERQHDAADATLHAEVDTLAERLVAATDSVIASGMTLGLPIGYFGGSTGAAAALIAAARRPAQIAAVVSRGGRTELAASSVDHVRAPTLFIVGSRDDTVLAANMDTAARLEGPRRIEVIEGTSHLFEEPGALEQVARFAAWWFLQQFEGARPAVSASASH